MGKKTRDQRKLKKPKNPLPSLNQLLEAIEIEAEPTYQLKLCASALKLITDSNANNGSISLTPKELLDARLLKGTLFSRSGEARAALGQIEESVADFEQAVLTLLQDHSNEDNDDVACFKTLPEDHQMALAGFYLYLGQLYEEAPSLNYYEQGIGVLRHVLDHQAMDADTNKMTDIQKQLSGAYCSIADLYMTDLCYEENAEQACEAAVKCALELESEKGVEALQALANLRLSQSRTAEATDSMFQVWTQLNRGCNALAELVGLGSTDSNTNTDNDDSNNKPIELQNAEEVNALPGFEFRCQTAKLFLECSGASEIKNQRDKVNRCCECAVQVLGSLLAENDEVIELWYLVGRAALTMQPPDYEMGQYHLDKAKEMLDKIIQNTMNESDDDEETEMIKSQLEEVMHLLESVPPEAAEGTEKMDES